MALAGWDTDTMLTSSKPTLRLSEAGNMDLARTSDLVTDSMSSLSIEAEELETYLDKVAKTAASSNTNIDALMEAFVGSGGTISNLKIPLSEASALLGVMANRGTKGSEAYKKSGGKKVAGVIAGAAIGTAILPELSGTTAERLSAALRDAMANGIDPTTWDTVTAAKWLGLESLDLETQENIAKLTGEVAKSLPTPVIPLSSNIAKGALEDIQPLVEASNTLYDTFGTNLNSQFSPGYDISAPVAITASYTLTNPLQSIDFVGDA